MARKILLADDSVTAQNMGRKILTDAGYEVVTVNNGSAALKRVAEQRPDLIVLDVYMPGYSGLEVCQRLKDAPETARIPILLTVGKLEPFKPEDARRVGADAFIVKPFEASELLSALTRLEDRIVPHADAPRFSNQVSGIERFLDDAPARKKDPVAEESESGWKSRIRFPSSKKKVEETEPETDFVTSPSFRDFRRGASTPPEKPRVEPVAETKPQVQEPGLVPDIPRDITPAELDALSALVAKLDGQIPASEEITALGEKLGPTPVASPEMKVEAAEIRAPAEAETAARTVEASVETKTAATEASPAAEMAAEPRHVWHEPEFVAAPGDREDEPVFSSAASAAPEAQGVERVVEAAAENKVAASSEVVESPEPPQAAEAAKIEDQPEGKFEAKAEVAPEVRAHVAPEVMPETAGPAEEMSVAAEALDEKVPSEEELAEALRLLTPSVNPAVAESDASPMAAVSEPAEPTPSGNGTAAKRWMAEAVALSSEEEAISLEAEMFHSLAMAAAPPAAAEFASMSAATVPNEAAEEAVAEAVAEAAIEPEAQAVEIMATAAQAAEPPSVEEHTVEVKAPDRDRADAISAAQTEPARGEEKEDQPAVTFANAAADGHHREEMAGGQESMGKEAKTKAGKSGWHQIRSATPSAKTDVVEAAKQAEAEAQAEETPKVMAAAAAADGSGSAKTAAPDPSAIASIVDSVLADLRPKIVEEIAKKLAGK